MNLFTDLDFGQVLKYLRLGRRVQRAGWNGKGMYLFYVQYPVLVNGVVDHEWLSFIAMKTVDDKAVPWLASQTDILASDWQVV